MLYTLQQYFAGERTETDSRDGAGRNGGADGSSEMAWLARSRFWGPAVERFGLTATEGPVAVLKVTSVFFLLFVFWALFDQHSSSWIRQAEMMDLTILSEPLVLATFEAGGKPYFVGLPEKILATQVPALNPLLVMLLIPLMNVVYNALDRVGLKTTPLRRITVGMLIAALSFVAVAWLQARIDAAGQGAVPVAWQFYPYLLITIAEVMVSITALEFSYTQAPKRMKSTIMGFYLLTVAAGNATVAVVAKHGNLPLVDFFWLFAGLMAVAGVIFALRAYFYVQKDYTQE
jgi:proton-dependent oligopeptide transporter, POT family